ncbi:hypothetical protein Ccar_07230 [Clostridium carboxidivorans P7]|uniref:Ig domain protein n=1 Tax=Clostridium carboxidivorans P7 TaxID=536227 RepID=C6PVR4_9CLOT|nr:Ig-like domain-containing protein [Clostridium carboxidivorans]AKN30632.1 hypothetical protein Ccar_07230 [Clostridium carboxidivorans P7]EET86688.1 Ig domain protein [Clostridium carboxidivorans P7]EFG86385.1 bacterial Ig-like domain (group 4) [Clostridium carboxidivorans P7]
MIKTSKKLLIFAGIVIAYQLNSHNIALASNVPPASKTQTISTNDKNTNKSQEDAPKVSTAQDTSKTLLQKNVSDSSNVENTFAFSTSNVDNISNVPLDKIWSIQFNQPINLSSAKSSIKIIDKKNNTEVPLNISLTKNNLCITISTISQYNSDNYYSLNIDKTLMSTSSKYLNTSFSMNFKTVSKAASIDKINSVDNMDVSINQSDSYKLPDTVTAVMSSGDKKQVKIIWDKPFDSSSIPGNYIFQGTIDGYSKKVILSLLVNAPNKNNLSSISTTSAWIWQLQDLVNKYGSIDNLISKLKSLGINNVCIKYHEGSSPTGGGMNFRDDFLKYENNFKQAGFKVGTWGFNHFTNVEAEANIIVDAINHSDYYVLDVEDAVIGKTSESEQVCSILRSKCPNAIIGYTSYPIASYHQDIPYSVFNKYCDFSAPQCYWGEMKWPIKKCMDLMIKDYKNYKLDKPIYPLIQTYDVYYSDYADYAAYKFKCSGLWSFDELDARCLDFLKCEGSKLNN